MITLSIMPRKFLNSQQKFEKYFSFIGALEIKALKILRLKLTASFWVKIRNLFIWAVIGWLIDCLPVLPFSTHCLSVLAVKLTVETCFLCLSFNNQLRAICVPRSFSSLHSLNHWWFIKCTSKEAINGFFPLWRRRVAPSFPRFQVGSGQKIPRKNFDEKLRLWLFRSGQKIQEKLW